MKKSYVIAALFVISAVSACGGGGTSTSPSTSSPAVSAAASTSPSIAATAAAIASTTALPSPSPVAPQPVAVEELTAGQIALALQQQVPEAGKITVITEDNDPNSLIGRPNGYTSAAIIHDDRLKSNADLGVEHGITIEVFADEDLAQARFKHIENAQQQFSFINDYYVLNGRTLLRGSEDLKPSQFKDYETAYRAVMAGEIPVLADASAGASAELANSAAPASSSAAVEESGALSLTVEEQAYTVEDLGDSMYVQYAFTLTNPNPATAGQFPRIRVTARDKDGKILGTNEDVLNEIGPGQTIAWTSQIDVTGKPRTLDIDYVSTDWMVGDRSPSDYPTWPSSNVSFADDGYAYKVTGEISNPYPETIDSARVTVLLRDRRGAIVGAGQTYPDGLEPSTPVPFETDAWVNEGAKPRTAEVYAGKW